MKHYASCFLCIALFSVSRNGISEDVWTTYTYSNQISALEITGEHIWCATSGGVVRWDRDDMTYRKFYVQDGLVNHQIADITSGPDGSIWCVSNDGLSRLDGTKWTSYRRDLDYAVEMTAAPDGSVWIAAHRNGLFRFYNDAWTQYTTSSGLVTDQLVAVAVDSSGGVWCAGEGGLSHYDGVQWTSYTIDNGMPSEYITSVDVAPDGTVWIGSKSGLSRLDGDSWHHYYPDPNFYGVSGPLTFDPEGNIWFDSPFGRIYQFDGEQLEWFPPASEPYGIGYAGSSIAFDDDGVRWYGTARGLKRSEGDSTVSYQTDDILVTDSIRSIVRSSHANMWCVNGNVVYCYDGVTWRRYSGEDYSFNELTVAPDGQLWALTTTGIARFDGDIWQTHPLENWFDGHSDKQLTSIAVDHDGYVWVGSSGSGILQFDGISWNNYTTLDGLSNNNVRDIFVDGNNDVWIGTDGGGISRFDGEMFTTIDAMSGLDRNYVRVLAGSPDGEIWCRTDTSLMQYDGNNWKNRYDIVSGSVYCILCNGNSDVWFGTNSGAKHYDGDTVTAFTTADGLADDYVATIAMDSNGGVWFGTKRGLSHYQPDSDTYAEKDVPKERLFAIESIRPNPFNPSTIIEFTLPVTAKIEVAVYNALGQKVRMLAAESFSAGHHAVRWDGRNDKGVAMSSGIYIVGLKQGTIVQSRRITLLR